MPDDAIRQTVTDKAKLTEIIGAPKPDVATKEMPALDSHCRHFLSLCPFLCISTADADGNQDVSPRGDPPGFVRVLDDTTILIPDRKGNRRVDTMRNILENPNVGLILMLPGVEEIVRINGKATLTEDPTLLADSAVNGSVPAMGIIVKIDDVFFHCAKAVIRSRLWDPETPIRRTEFPTYGEIVRDQRAPDGDPADINASLQDDYTTRLY
ncbi:MAG: PPOX class probable FMN-dependent enzyme [Paracoccaceae bacterium]|jgi:PPOX class probable FMN-dependent enzyme